MEIEKKENKFILKDKEALSRYFYTLGQIKAITRFTNKYHDNKTDSEEAFQLLGNLQAKNKIEFDKIRKDIIQKVNQQTVEDYEDIKLSWRGEVYEKTEEEDLERREPGVQ